MLRKLLSITISSVLVMGILAGCSGAQTATARVKKSGVLRVGLEGTYPPFNYVDEQKQMVGFDVDVSKEIARRLGAKAEFVGSEWKALIGGLQADKFDVIIAQMSITDERKQSVDFTDPYVLSGAVLIAKKGDSRFKKLDDIKGFKVGVGLGTTFETLAKSVQGAEVKSYDSFDQYAQELVNGRVDVIVNDQLLAAYAIKKGQLPIAIASPVLSEDRIGIAVKKGNAELVSQVNKSLTDMKTDGTYKQIFMQWFGVEPALK
jgi:cystine transport system substrate-binding protein